MELLERAHEGERLWGTKLDAVMAYSAAFTALAQLERGDPPAAAAETLHRVHADDPRPDGARFWLASLAELALADGRPADALGDHRASGAARPPDTHPVWAPWRSLRTRALAALGDVTEARRLALEDLELCRRVGATWVDRPRAARSSPSSPVPTASRSLARPSRRSASPRPGSSWPRRGRRWAMRSPRRASATEARARVERRRRAGGGVRRRRARAPRRARQRPATRAAATPRTPSLIDRGSGVGMWEATSMPSGSAAARIRRSRASTLSGTHVAQRAGPLGEAEEPRAGGPRPHRRRGSGPGRPRARAQAPARRGCPTPNSRKRPSRWPRAPAPGGGAASAPPRCRISAASSGEPGPAARRKLSMAQSSSLSSSMPSPIAGDRILRIAVQTGDRGARHRAEAAEDRRAPRSAAGPRAARPAPGPAPRRRRTP